MKRFLLVLMAPLPSFLKVFLMRQLLGYEIGPDVRIGLSLVFPDKCRIGARTRIGHFNYIARMSSFVLGEDVIIGHFNILLGGESVTLGDGAMIGRFNEINSILVPLARGTPDPSLLLERRSVVTAWHKIDFTDRVVLGDSAILAGRLSNLWTHNRQNVGPVTIGAHCYVGSGIQMAPGSSVGDSCVVGMGAVITRPLESERVLVAGVPAKVVKPLDDDAIALVTFPTRPDLDDPDTSAGRN